MARLIDADELKEELKDMDIVIVKHNVEDLIDEQPTVDAVSVVRCGQCIYFRKGYCVHPAQDMIPVMAGHFCGYGYRKEGD